MNVLRSLVVLLLPAFLLAAFHPVAHADSWDKTTKVTFSEPVQVPGKTLPAGTYIFKLLDSPSNRHIVQIFNEDHTSLITTILAIPNYRLEPAGKTILTYDERPADQPVALAAWFYPGDNSGQEFAYPKAQAEQLSQLNKREVPSTGSEEAYPDQLQSRTNETEAAAPAPQPSSEPMATPTPAPAENQVAVQQEAELPHTGSYLPLIGFASLMLLGTAALLRVALRA